MRRSQEGKQYRQTRREAMGEEAFKAEEARKRRERRARARTTTEPTEEKKETEQDDGLLEQVFKAKILYLSKLSPPKTIKKASVKQQLEKVRNLYKKKTGRTGTNIDFTFLRDTNSVIQFVNQHWKTANSRNSQIQAISSILQVIGGYETEYKFYSRYSTDKRNEINDGASENTLSEREAKNILPWGQIENLYMGISDPRDKALVGIYTLLPPRRVEDISLLTLSDTDENLSPNYNYLVVDNNNNPTDIVYLRYKTDKSYGRVDLNIPETLRSILKDYITSASLGVGDPLFGKSRNGYYSNFSEIVSNTFKKYTKKSITANLLRHSYISDFLSTKRSLAQKTNISKIMGHSVDTQGQYDRIDL